MNIQINDPQKLLDQSSNVAQLANNISHVQEDLQSLCTQIGNAWQSDTVDKESYLSSLNTTLTKVSSLVGALSSLSKNLQVYAQNQMKTANNG